jgi:hypothetical protein
MPAIGDRSPASSTANAPRAAVRADGGREESGVAAATGSQPSEVVLDESKIAAAIGSGREPAPAATRLDESAVATAISGRLARPAAAPGPTGRPCEARSTRGASAGPGDPACFRACPRKRAERVSRSSFPRSPAVPSAEPGPWHEGGRLAAAALSFA